MCQNCCKCGEEITKPALPAAIDHYCRKCKVRLGYLSRIECGVIVRPDSADFYQRQMDEPILETWVIETELKREKVFEHEQRSAFHNRRTARRFANYSGSDALDRLLNGDGPAYVRNGHVRDDGDE